MYIEASFSSIQDLLQQIEKLGGEGIFRGQGNEMWPLLPKIGRFDPLELHYGDWPTFEEHLLEQFRKYSIPFISEKPATAFDWLVLAQHHGLPTRLLV